MLIGLVALAEAAIRPTVILGVGASASNCDDHEPGDRTFSHFRLGPTAGVGLEADIGRSHLVLSATSSPMLGYRCYEAPFVHLLAADASWMFRAGPVFIGPHLSGGLLAYLATGLQIEGRSQWNNISLIPTFRLSVRNYGMLEAHVLLRATFDRPEPP